MSKTVRGTIYTLVAGTAWGLSGTSGQYLMVHGFSALSLTNFRLLVAGGVFWSGVVRTARWPQRRGVDPSLP